MPPDVEKVIKLSAAVEQLRREVMDTMTLLAKKQEQLTKLEHDLRLEIGAPSEIDAARQLSRKAYSDALKNLGDSRAFHVSGLGPIHKTSIIGPIESLKAPTGPTGAASSILGGMMMGDGTTFSDASLAAQVRELFNRHPNTSFSIAEVAVQLGFGPQEANSLRQTLSRLYDSGFLMREKRGQYLLRPPGIELVAPEPEDPGYR